MNTVIKEKKDKKRGEKDDKKLLILFLPLSLSTLKIFLSKYLKSRDKLFWSLWGCCCWRESSLVLYIVRKDDVATKCFQMFSIGVEL
jgi:hypothetical protein